jgi:hypothetical protein
MQVNYSLLFPLPLLMSADALLDVDDDVNVEFFSVLPPQEALVGSELSIVVPTSCWVELAT